MKQSSLIKNKKAQAWSLDLVVGVALFTFGIILLYVYAINYSSQTKNQLDQLLYEGNLASQLILSEKESGILSNGKINQTRLEIFYNGNYQLQKEKFGLVNDFYFTMNALEINSTPVSYVGKINNSEIESLIQITRLTIYKNTPTKFKLFVWE